MRESQTYEARARPGARLLFTLLVSMNTLLGEAAMSSESEEADRRAVAQLDIEFQRAVKANNAAAMSRIMHPSMVLILGDGRIETRDQQLIEADEKRVSYEIQDEDPGTKTTRVYGDAAIVTARLHIRGTVSGRAFDRRLWFSDVYIRTKDGWKYALGQASLALPNPTVSGQSDEAAHKPG
jgi:ketosteroid isomerase-like protein